MINISPLLFFQTNIPVQLKNILGLQVKLFNAEITRMWNKNKTAILFNLFQVVCVDQNSLTVLSDRFSKCYKFILQNEFV